MRCYFPADVPHFIKLTIRLSPLKCRNPNRTEDVTYSRSDCAHYIPITCNKFLVNPSCPAGGKHVRVQSKNGLDRWRIFMAYKSEKLPDIQSISIKRRYTLSLQGSWPWATFALRPKKTGIFRVFRGRPCEKRDGTLLWRGTIRVAFLFPRFFFFFFLEGGWR